MRVRAVRRRVDPPTLGFHGFSGFSGPVFVAMRKHAELGVDAAAHQKRGGDALPRGLRVEVGEDGEREHVALVRLEHLQHHALLHVPDLHIPAAVARRHSTSNFPREATETGSETAPTTPPSSRSSPG